MTLIQRVTRVGTAPETAKPDPAKLISGDPVHTTWNLEERDGLYCGLWQSTAGKWQVSYAEIYVHDVCWPDFGAGQLHEAFRDYGRRVRKFGKVL